MRRSCGNLVVVVFKKLRNGDKFAMQNLRERFKRGMYYEIRCRYSRKRTSERVQTRYPKNERKRERKQKICRNCNNKNTTRWGWRRRRLHEETTEQSVAPWDCRDPSLQIATRRVPFGKNFAVNVKNCGAERRRETKRRCTNGQTTT